MRFKRPHTKPKFCRWPQKSTKEGSFQVSIRGYEELKTFHFVVPARLCSSFESPVMICLRFWLSCFATAGSSVWGKYCNTRKHFTCKTRIISHSTMRTMESLAGGMLRIGSYAWTLSSVCIWAFKLPAMLPSQLVLFLNRANIRLQVTTALTCCLFVFLIYFLKTPNAGKVSDPRLEIN